jgi:hypothetical protein
MNRSHYPQRSPLQLGILALFPVALLLYSWVGGYDFKLEEIEQLHISQATLDGVAVSKRVRLFYGAVLAVLLLVPLLFVGLRRLQRYWGVSRQAMEVPAVVGAGGLLLILSHVMGVRAAAGVELFAYLFVLHLLVAVLAARRMVPRFVALPAFAGGLAALAITLYGALLLLYGEARAQGEVVFLVLYMSLGVGLSVAKAWTGWSFRRLFWLFLPVAAVPVLLFVAVEAVFWAKARLDIFLSYKWCFLIAFLLIAVLVNTWVFTRKQMPPVRTLSRRFLVPAALLTFLLLAFYQPVMEQPQELFELANPSNALMRMFAFGELPFVDFLSSHVFSEQYYGILHALVHGYDGSLDFLTYRFFDQLIVYGLVYGFVARLLGSPYLGLLFVLLFPYVDVLSAKMLFASVLAFYAGRRVVARPTVRGYAGLLLLLVLYFFWKLDLGTATLFASLLFLPLLHVVERRRPVGAKWLKAAGTVLALGLVAVLAVSLLRSPGYVWGNFVNALHYAGANQAHGYSQMASTQDHIFYFFHLLLPVGGVLLVLYQVWQLWAHPAAFSSTSRFTRLASVFFALVFLGNFQRGLVRHGFMEGQDTFLASTFFLALSLSFYAALPIRTAAGRWASWAGLSFLVIVALKHFPLDQRPAVVERYLTQPAVAEVGGYFNEAQFTGKVRYDEAFANANYADLKQFFDAALSPGQTFLDFSNTPMLYYYCQRRVPAYFCQNLQNTVGDHLQIDHISRLDPDQVPVVVYAHYPREWWDATDGVANAMRYYLMAAYIYANYQPLGVIDNRSIWVHKNGAYQWSTSRQDELLAAPQRYDYKQAAAFMHTYYTQEKAEALQLLGTLEAEAKGSTEVQEWELPAGIAPSQYVLAEVQLAAPQAASLSIEIHGLRGLLGTAAWQTVPGRQSYMVPLSNHYLWQVGGARKIVVRGAESQLKLQFYKYAWDEG